MTPGALGNGQYARNAGQPVGPAAPRLVRLPNRVLGTSVRRLAVLRVSVRAVVRSVDGGGVCHAAAASWCLRLQRHSGRLLMTAWLDCHAVLDVHHGVRDETTHRVVPDQVPEPGAR